MEMIAVDITKFPLSLIVQNCPLLILLIDDTVLKECDMVYIVAQEFCKRHFRELFAAQKMLKILRTIL